MKDVEEKDGSDIWFCVEKGEEIVMVFGRLVVEGGGDLFIPGQRREFEEGGEKGFCFKLIIELGSALKDFLEFVRMSCLISDLLFEASRAEEVLDGPQAEVGLLLLELREGSEEGGEIKKLSFEAKLDEGKFGGN